MRETLQLIKTLFRGAVSLIAGLLHGFLSMKLRYKYILSLFLFIFFPFLVFGIVSYQASEKTIRDNVSSLALKNVTKIGTSIDNYLQDIQSVTSILFTSQDLNIYFKSLSTLPVNSDNNSQYEKLASSNNGYEIISNILGLLGDRLSGIYFYDDKNIYFVHPAYSYYLHHNFETGGEWYRKALHSGNKMTTAAINGGESILMARAVKDPHNYNITGVIRIDLDHDRFKGIIDMEYDGSYKNSSLSVLDSDNNIIYKSGSNFNVKSSPSLNGNRQSGVYTQIVNNKEMYIAYYTSPYTSWKIVNMIPADEVLKDLNRIRNIVVSLAAACVLIILFFSSFLSSMLVKPIYQLSAAMEKVERGDFSTRVNLKSRDETGYLADSFNRMTSNIEVLINKVYNAELKQKEAELHSLQSQINPHFLYNTLESIRGVALTHNIKSIASMSKSLSQLFRYSINSRVLVPLSEEMQHLENYMTIQNFRHDDKFELICDIPEEAYKYSLLKLTLQPIVENSIKHGLEMEMGKGRIIIEAVVSEGMMTFIVSDNGKGIPPDKVTELNNLLTDGKKDNENYLGSGTGIGVQNVNSRLKLHFGDQYGLRFIKSDTGAKVEITLPALEWKESAV